MATILVTCLSSCMFAQKYYENAKTRVWIKDADIRYHRETCMYVNDSAIEVYLGYAVDENRKPCPVCRPERLVVAPPNSTRDLDYSIIGAIIVAALAIGIPMAVPRYIRFQRGKRAVRCLAGDSWLTLPKNERKKRILASVARQERKQPGKKHDYDAWR